MTNEIKQLSFADMEDKRPLPIRLANERKFKLQHYIDGETYLYSVTDWIQGVGDSKNGKQVWADIKRRYPDSELLDSVQRLPYLASNGKNYQMDFTTDKGLYLVTQKMVMDSDLRDKILGYLAESGAKMDEWYLHPDRMMSVAQSRMLKDIERYEKAGLGDRPEIVLLKARHESIVTSETLRKTIARVCDNPNYAQITNAEYMALFGKIAKDLKEMLKTKSIRDSLGIHQIRALTLAEGVLEDMLRRNRETTNESILGIIEIAIKPIGRYLLETSQALGVHHITGKPLLGSGRQE